MRRFQVAESVLRDLVARFPYYEIARMYKCDTRTVGALAACYGLSSAFVAKAGTAEEIERIRELSAQGWPIKQIADTLGRSQEFVSRRVKAVAESGEVQTPYRRPSRAGWPLPYTSAEEALGEQQFDDMDEQVLARECPPHLRPLNGAALASAAQAANRSYSRSSADLCADE
ncbi:MAG: helix-turn-helix domain-containing protein [Rhodospirillaceae bacterium]|nr:MAG: helix-turn-helix domain-containing protein [Rhodospirillaceae bacterium]